jgi:pyridoxine kinase
MSETKKLPRAIAIHDLSGFGKCALTIALPVLSACGVEVCPLPTAILSANTDFKGFTLKDCSGEIEKHIDHWKALGLCADAVYSGFLSSESQIDIILHSVEAFRPSVVLIDPVMADEGKLYKTYTKAMCESMKALMRAADLTTPNLTEACVLNDRLYDPLKTSPADIEALARGIAALGAKRVVITGIERGDMLYNCILDENGYSERGVPRLNCRMHGTGDLFASVLLGGLLTGHTLYESVDSAAFFVPFAMEKSMQYEDYMRRGICFEPYLNKLAGGIAK